MDKSYKEEVISYFEVNCKITISEAMGVIKEKMRKDFFDNDIRVGNVRLFFSNNPKFAEGGSGWYLYACGLHGRSGTYVKL